MTTMVMEAKSLPADPDSQQNLVTFQLGLQTCALPIQSIVQIIPMLTITPVPQASPSVLGIINIRGSLVPVISLHLQFDLPAPSFRLYTPILLIQHNARVIGLVVDEVLDVFPVSMSEIRHPKDILPDELVAESIVRGLLTTPKGVVILLNVERLFSRQQERAWAEAQKLLQAVDKPAPDGHPSASQEQPGQDQELAIQEIETV